MARSTFGRICIIALLLLPASLLQADEAKYGGLAVVIGPESPNWVADLADDYTCVLWLFADSEFAGDARASLVDHDAYGRIIVDSFDGETLPLIDNSVNWLNVDDGVLSDKEISRVLCPGGKAHKHLKSATIDSIDKRRPKEIDTWTHFLHDPSNNAVAHDTVIDVPRRLQWTGGPRYSRHHDHMASVSAMVCDGPRMFYIIDMGSRWSIETPADWHLVARDAFNGATLWDQPMGEWFSHHYSLKSGPGDLPRRLVAVGEDVYFTRAIDAPLERLNARTGETEHVYEGTASTEEILYHDGTLFLKVNDPENQLTFETIAQARQNNGGVPFNLDPREVVAVDAQSGRVLWRKASGVMPTTLAVDSERVYFHDGDAVVCLDRESGDQLWRRELPRWTKMLTFYTPTLVVYEGIVLFSGGENMVPHRAGIDAMTAIDATTGDVMWTADHPQSGYQSAEDLLVAGGLVWTGETTQGGLDGNFTGRDPLTGEVKNAFGPDVDTYWFHHRCYRGKATDNFLLMSRTGIEFLDPADQTWDIHHWVRGGCLYGVMPCNGMVYTPPTNCACYPEIKLYGFNALASDNAAPFERTPEAERLEKGPAFGTKTHANTRVGDWPTYRGNNARSGRTDFEVAGEDASLDVEWKTQLGGKITPPVVAGGRVYIATVENHMLHALDEASGKEVWSYTIGGRIDSPPTCFAGCVYFGGADGWVYCVRAEDGELAWRYQATPSDRRLLAYEQIESLWPVKGSVLIEGGKLYTVAGRNLFLDGGMRLVILDPQTGELLGENYMDDTDPETGEDLQSHVMVLNMPAGLNDIMSSDGENIYMMSQIFDKQGKRGPLGPHSGEPAGQGSVQGGETAHLFAPYGGFMDGDWFHRSYWVYGRSFAGGHSGYHQAGKFTASGRILVFDDDHVYGFGRQPEYYKWTTPLEHHLFQAKKEPLTPTKGPAASNNVVEVPITPVLNAMEKPLVVQAWVKSEAPRGVVLARGGPMEGFALTVQAGKPSFLVRAKSELFRVDAPQRITGKWTHLTGVLTSDKKLKIYVNGELAGESNAKQLLATDPKQPMEIGSDEMSPVGEYKSPNTLTGLVDDVKIYFGEMTDEEIAKSASADPSEKIETNATLALHVSFDDGTAKDLSGGKSHGTLAKTPIEEGAYGKAVRFQPTAQAAGGQQPKFFVAHEWSKEIPLLARAMVMTGDTLFVMGPPDVLDEDAAFESVLNADLESSLQRQDDAMRGKFGTKLLAVSASTGEVLAMKDFEEFPRWDGLIAVGGKLILTTEDGSVMRLGK